MTVKWRHCALAERDHKEDIRNYAHTYHYENTICLAEAFWELPRQYRDGIILHEIGHLIAGSHGSEDEANEAAYEWSGSRIQYVDSPYGRHLERLANMAGARVIGRRRNPIHHGQELPYDEWVPSHAVKFNSDGTVDVMTEAHHNRGLHNIAAGFHDEEGIFHPIRSSFDYDPSRVGEVTRAKKKKKRPAAKKKRRR